MVRLYSSPCLLFLVAVTKRIAEAHGWLLTYSSSGEGRGTSFVLEVPLAKRRDVTDSQITVYQRAYIEENSEVAEGVEAAEGDTAVNALHGGGGGGGGESSSCNTPIAITRDASRPNSISILSGDVSRHEPTSVVEVVPPRLTISTNRKKSWTPTFGLDAVSGDGVVGTLALSERSLMHRGILTNKLRDRSDGDVEVRSVDDDVLPAMRSLKAISPVKHLEPSVRVAAVADTKSDGNDNVDTSCGRNATDLVRVQSDEKCVQGGVASPTIVQRSATVVKDVIAKATVVADQRTALAELSVLVVDEVYADRKMLLRTFSKSYGRCDEAADTAAALARASSSMEDSRFPFDIIVVSASLPAGGAACVSELRALGFHGCVIGLAAPSAAVDRTNFQLNGADLVLSKPPDMKAVDQYLIGECVL